MNAVARVRYADAHAESAEPGNTTRAGMSAFSRKVAKLLERVEYRRCDSGEDLEDIYRLRYEAYRLAGLIGPMADRRFVDEYDDLPNAYTFGVYFDGHLVSTIRLHHITPACPKGPSLKVFSDQLLPRLATGESFIDPSRFAADHEWSAALRVLPYITLRLAQVACRHFKPNACLTTIREEHAAFYIRVLHAELIKKGEMYPGLTVAGHLYQSRCPEALDKVAAEFPFFESTPLEQRLLFARERGAPGPLTVLPSAKYLVRAA